MLAHEVSDAQELWRGRLKEAENRYRGSTGQAREAARQEYLRVLRIFSDLVIRGKTPPDRPDHS